MVTEAWSNKVLMHPADSHPLCPWCETPLHTVCWHKVRGGPSFGYAAVLSCPHCLGVIDCVANTAG
ncbi:MAG: hypothetical protein ACREMF_10665 [Gemmatimonadales bacterium]